MEKTNNTPLVVVLTLLVRDFDVTVRLNDVLHRHGRSLMARMGLPNWNRGFSIITVVVDASADELGALERELKALPGVEVQKAVVDEGC